VGGTSGLGLSTLLALARHTSSPNIYILGRNKDALPSIESSCKTVNPDAKVHFLRSDVTELRNVDQVCKEVKEKTQRLNLLVMSQGNLNLRGRDGAFPPLSFCYLDCRLPYLLRRFVNATSSHPFSLSQNPPKASTANSP
jgi:NAD(P)-dependent dehydrogenase (short-subunit alcohol dehydrogenase family)